MKFYLYGDDACGEGAPDGRRKRMLRAAASDYLGTEIAQDRIEEILRTEDGPHGKPRFATPPLRDRVHFSISHSGRYWAVLFHDDEVGLDIEDLSIRSCFTRERMEKISERFFSVDEKEYLLNPCSPGDGTDRASGYGCDIAAGKLDEAGDYPDDVVRFFRLWTAKESYIKYTGGGMSEGLTSFSIFDPPGDVTITTVAPAPGLVCSYCLRSAPESPDAAASPDTAEAAAPDATEATGSAEPTETTNTPQVEP
jgi:phosphopantetheinyl transferase